MKAAIALGVVNGLGVALLALGLVLVYKASRFVNFAQGQMGVTSAMVLGKLVLDWGWSWTVAFPVAVATGAAIGAAVQVLIIRRLSGRSRLSLLIATIGLAQVLLALTYVESLGPDPGTLVRQGFPVPFRAELRVDELLLRGGDVFMLIAAPLAALSLALLLKYTRLGKSIRAAASNPEAASLAGISIPRISLIVWCLAGALSAMTAVLLAPGQAAFDVQAFGPGLMLRGLGAAALAGFTSLPIAFAAGILLGVVEAVALHHTHAGGTAEAIIFAVILLGLIARSRALHKAGVDFEPLDIDDRPIVVPPALAQRPLVRFQRPLLGGFGLFVGLVAPLLPGFNASEDRFRLTLTLAFAMVALSVTVLTGWAGQVSLGQFAFVGIGAYVAVRLVPHDWSMPAMMLAAGGVGAIVAMLIGLPALRVRGLTLAVTTLGFAVVAPGWLFEQDWFAESSVATVPPPAIRGLGELSSQLDTYYAALAALVVTMASVAALRRSQVGQIILAVRDNEPAAASFGVSPTGVKLGAFALSGFIAAAAGVVWLGAWRSVSPPQIGPQDSLLMLAMAVIGGLGSLPGAVLGSVFVYAIPAFTADFFKSVFSNSIEFSLLLGGTGLIIGQLRFPGGIALVLRRGWQRLLLRIANDYSRREDATVGSGDEAQVLVVRNVTRRFGGVTALDDVTLHVKPGEIVGLIGSNGAGKSTLINVISGLLAGERGSVRVFGRDLAQLGPEYRAHFGVARSFQDARLFPALTVCETIELSLSRDSRTGILSATLAAPWARFARRRARLRAADIVERFGLSQWADVPVGELSTGTRRICDLAAQVAAQPKVLLLDEPTAGVAQREAEAFGPLLRRIRDELDCAVLLVEHDMPLMLGLADRIYCLESGRVIAEGTPAEIRDNPLVIASYLGTDTAAIQRSGPTTNGRRSRNSKPQPSRRR